MIKIGDSVIAQRGDRQQVGVVCKADDVSSDTYPDRNVFSVRFPIDTEFPATFVWNEGSFWKLPDKYKFEAYIKKILRGEEVLWTEES